MYIIKPFKQKTWNSSLEKNMYEKNDASTHRSKDTEESVFLYISNDDGDPEDNAFYLRISRLSISVQCTYWSQNLLKLNL